MRKVLSILLAAMLLCLCACGGDQASESSGKPTSSVTVSEDAASDTVTSEETSLSEPEPEPEPDPALEAFVENGGVLPSRKPLHIARGEIHFPSSDAPQDGLETRCGPGEEYEVITKLKPSSYIRVCGITEDWHFILSDGQYGWVSADSYDFLPPAVKKPVIYLYPTVETDVRITLKLTDGKLTCTYPEYGSGWDVIARPDGTIVNKADLEQYAYLYWEAVCNIDYDLSKGFVVKGEDTADFLHKTLNEMGLNVKERTDFITYWLPRMQGNAYNLITFQTDAYTDSAKLNIDPNPERLLRVFMAFKPLDAPIDLPAPDIEHFERVGFTVVEWGGTELK